MTQQEINNMQDELSDINNILQEIKLFGFDEDKTFINTNTRTIWKHLQRTKEMLNYTLNKIKDGEL
jgi:hypothetical protein